MRANHDDAAVVIVECDHLLSCEERLICNSAHHLYDRSGRAEHEYLAGFHSAVERDTEHLHISVIYCVYDDLVEVFDSH